MPTAPDDDLPVQPPTEDTTPQDPDATEEA
jgi:hypothetical protein